MHGIRQELWKSDGTPAGTVLVKQDIQAGIDSPRASVDGILFFTADDGETGEELWKSDGTPAGTVLVRDIFPGSDDPEIADLTKVGDTLFFVADDGTSGRELWKSDGTPEGTVMVKDIRPGPEDSSIGGLTNVDGTLFFRANDGTNGWSLWKSDGALERTVRIQDLFPSALTNVNGTLFFTNVAGIWKSDGTQGGTEVVGARIGPRGLRHLTNVGNALYFTADDGLRGQELWVLEATLGDTNYDGVVDVTDLDNVRNNFGRAGNTFPGDTTGDGVIDIDDLNAVRNNFGIGAKAADEGSRVAHWRDGTSSSESRRFVMNDQALAAMIMWRSEPRFESQAARMAFGNEIFEYTIPVASADEVVRTASIQSTPQRRGVGLWRASRGHENDATSAAWDQSLLDFVRA